jgi:hypothetical protein
MSQSGLWCERAIRPSRMAPPSQGRAGLSLAGLATDEVLAGRAASSGGAQRSAVRIVFRELKNVFEPTCSASLIEEQETESSQSRDPIQNSCNPVGSLPAVHRSSEAASTHGNLDFSHASSLWVGRTASILD